MLLRYCLGGGGGGAAISSLLAFGNVGDAAADVPAAGERAPTCRTGGGPKVDGSRREEIGGAT